MFPEIVHGQNGFPVQPNNFMMYDPNHLKVIMYMKFVLKKYEQMNFKLIVYTSASILEISKFCSPGKMLSSKFHYFQS